MKAQYKVIQKTISDCTLSKEVVDPLVQRAKQQVAFFNKKKTFAVSWLGCAKRLAKEDAEAAKAASNDSDQASLPTE